MPRVGSTSKSMVQQQIDTNLLRQASAKSLKVGITQFEIHRNKVPKKVKLLDVKLSFSYQEDFTTKTERLERQLVRHGKKWTWQPTDGDKSILTFSYAPGDRVNLNFGLIVHKTKRMGMFSSETLTTQVGNVTECIVLAKNSGVGVALPINTTIHHHFRLNFNIGGYGHHMTVKMRLEQLGETKANPSLWLRPCSMEKPFRSAGSLLSILKDADSFPPRQKVVDEENAKSYICSNQRLVNSNRSAVVECWSVRPCLSESDIPSGIQIRQVAANKPVACLIPVVENISGSSDGSVNHKHLKLSILVICPEGPYCLCSTKWRSPDKFDFKLHYYEDDEVWGQRIKWASRDFLDIDHIIMNSTGHQYYFKQDTKTPLQDLCIGLCVKYLVRWNDETLPWKREGSRPLSLHDLEPDLSFGYNSSESLPNKSCAANPLESHMESLPSFLESQNLALFYEVESKVSVTKVIGLQNDTARSRLARKGSGSSYGSFHGGGDRYIKNEKRRSIKKKSAIESKIDSDGDDFTSGFVDDFAGCSETRTGSYIESYIE
ncbi:uncharacterized protein [Argopecten irradians]|uniref:uncharacterized protein n=1 Tax=Argopecten irradians TaxID=31199 RepID=UPI00371C3559